ncbi:helix-turn-helix transcriptional regulator [Flavobacterium selenitireducens]|uniref:helix-turn-helix transcriptional regulator n=1 Tax=Flavobacterium selenitireducens TaxID=2722704 RepID=UPI00168A6CB9|nr:AraC family transcriptional regulator [Flavobacterium selenitireducens]MBD3581291.1 helix-turn-helix transcriptional regulator [Flavobacterium selenitireducens]
MSRSGSIHTIEGFERCLFETACRQFKDCRSNDWSDSNTIVMFDSVGSGKSESKFELLTFILDREFRIESASEQIGFHTLSILKMPFYELIATESKAFWSALEAHIVARKYFSGTFQITFVSQQKTLRPALCSITRLGNSGRTVIMGIFVNCHHALMMEPVVPKNTVNEERLRIENLYHYIFDNLDGQLPSTRELARLFGTNDHTLKEGFRKMFGTSIYQFYLAEKLKRAHLYIEQSTIPLHKIANDLGFGTYGNFTKAFRKKYGYTPSAVKRWEDTAF